MADNLSRRTVIAGAAVTLATIGSKLAETATIAPDYVQLGDGSFIETNPLPRPPEWGESIEWGAVRNGDGWMVIEFREADVIEALHKAAHEKLPPNTRYELRKRISGSYGRQHGMAWYRIETMDRRPSWGMVPSTPTMAQDDGYYFLGEFVTPNDTNTARVLAAPLSESSPIPRINV